MTTKQMRNRMLLSLFALLLVTVAFTGVKPVSAVNTAVLTPSTGSALLNMPFTYKATGLNVSASYTVKLDGVQVLSFVSSSAGDYSFDITVVTAGTHTVGLYSVLIVSCVASATLVGTDVMAIMIPAIILFVSVSIILGIAEELKV